jgi:hypothetical protein
LFDFDPGIGTADDGTDGDNKNIVKQVAFGMADAWVR